MKKGKELDIRQEDFAREIIKDLGRVQTGAKNPRRLLLKCTKCDNVEDIPVRAYDIHKVQEKTLCAYCTRMEGIQKAKDANTKSCINCGTSLKGKDKRALFCSVKCKEKVKDSRKSKEQIMLWNSRTRAKQRGLECDITIEDIVIPEVCPVLHIPIFKAEGRQSGEHNSPSIDRIDSNKGYIKGNVRVISLRANMLKSNGTLEEMRLVVDDLERIENETKTKTT